MTRPPIILLVIILLLSTGNECFSSQVVRIKGSVSDSTGNPLAYVNVYTASKASGTFTDSNGFYSLNLSPDSKEVTVVFSFVGFRTEKRIVQTDRNDVLLDIVLFRETGKIDEITVISRSREPGLTILRLPVKDISFIPSASGSFESLIKTLPGVSSNNELSSQYSVRGGNFDENLVYVNDNEIYRSFLIRSGQQEGLSFINPDLVSTVHFSSGGFGASYGDKLSSVLDIRYKKPASNRGSVSLGLLTSSAHHQGISRDGRFSWLSGVRYKSTRMMLKTLDSKGDYQPVYGDIQTLLSYKTGRNSLLNLLFTYSSNTYNFIPQSRVSNFGTEASAFQLFVLFNGGEKDRYSTWNGVLSWEYNGISKLNHKVQISSFLTSEKEYFDIRGYYSLSNLDKTYGSENFSDTLMNIGIGSWHSHARNKLFANIGTVTYKGEKLFNAAELKWGAGIRNYTINDRIREWTMVDSAGYSVPYDEQGLRTQSLIASVNNLMNWTISSYIESIFPVRTGSFTIMVNPGVRCIYNSFSDEFLISPRASASIEATDNISVWISGGYYYQLPFYREMRFPDGTINKGIKSQYALHAVAGMSYDFKSMGRPFRLTAEIYNKKLENIIPYRLDNVRLNYSGRNEAIGYSRGIDIRLNGEFVTDAESWISVSLMDSKLEIPGTELGKFPSPSDQTLSLDMFFQDYLPGTPSLRAHINISFATGFPIVSPFNSRYDQYYRLPPYRRVDLGLTKVIRNDSQGAKEGRLFRYFTEIIAGVEIFNLLDINNTISYLWVKTVNDLSGSSHQYAIPNYLTGRSLNFKISAAF